MQIPLEYQPCCYSYSSAHFELFNVAKEVVLDWPIIVRRKGQLACDTILRPDYQRRRDCCKIDAENRDRYPVKDNESHLIMPE
jgi:hypothetical protein